MGISFYAPQQDLSGDFITVKTAAISSSYNQQYLRRLLGDNVFQSKKIGQMWFIDRSDFLQYVHFAKKSKDKRFGPS